MLKKNNLASILTFLLSLAVLATWVSQSILDLASGLIGIIALSTLFFKSSRTELFNNSNLNKALPWMVAYFTIACLGYYFNGRPGADIVFSLTRFSWILLVCVLTWAFRHIDLTKKSVHWFYLLLSIPAVYGFNVFLNNGVDYLSGKSTDGRIVGFVQSATYHSHIGGFLFVAAFCWLYLKYLQSGQRKALKEALFSKDFLYWLVALLLLLTVVFARTRGALLSIVISIGVLFFIKHRWKFVKFVGAPLLVLFVGLATYTPLKNYLIRKDGDSCRWVLALVHVEMIKSHPFLGIGYRDNMRQISDFWPEEIGLIQCKEARIEGSQAHNQLLNVAATTGLLGLIAYLGMLIYFFALNWRWYKKDQDDLALVCLISQMYFQLSCLTEITFEFSKIRFLILVIWAIIAAKAPSKISSQQNT